jgi:hypothetical protein
MDRNTISLPNRHGNDQSSHSFRSKIGWTGMIGPYLGMEGMTMRNQVLHRASMILSISMIGMSIQTPHRLVLMVLPRQYALLSALKLSQRRTVYF